MTLSGNGAVLSNEDVIEDVLHDGDFVHLCKHDTFTSRIAFYSQAVVNGAPVTESAGGCKMNLPTYTLYPMPLNSYSQLKLNSLVIKSATFQALSGIEVYMESLQMHYKNSGTRNVFIIHVIIILWSCCRGCKPFTFGT